MELSKLRNISLSRILGTNNQGRRFSIRCQQHNDKTPSLVIYPDNGFYCFSCGVNGKGAIDFLVKVLGVSFKEACQELSTY